MSTLAVCCSVFPGVRASGLITGISCPAGPPFLPHAVMFRPGILVFYAPFSSLETFSIFQQKAEKFSPAKFKSAFLRNKMYGAAIYIFAGPICVCLYLLLYRNVDTKNGDASETASSALHLQPLPVSAGAVACKFHAKICEIFDFK